MDLLGKHKINVVLQKLNIFDGSHFVKVCHILITFTAQTFNIWLYDKVITAVRSSSKICSRYDSLLLNLWSIPELNCLLVKTWFWFSEETELIKQSWLMCLDDVRVYSFWISGFLDCHNIWRADNLHWL